MTSRIKSKAARVKLEDRTKPYFEPIAGTGVSIGYRSSSRKWIARWFEAGKEIQRSLKTYADDKAPANGRTVMNYAQACKKAIELAGRPTDTDAADLTVDQTFTKYAANRDAAGRDTTDSWFRYKKWIKPELGNRRVTSITELELEDWRNEVAKHVKPATVNRTLTIFKACLKYGFERLKIPFVGMPIWKALEPLEVTDPGRDLWLSAPQLIRLANKCDFDLQRLVLAAGHTGARFGDLARLNCGDWDRKIKKVRIQNRKTNKPRFVPVTTKGALFFDHVTANGGRAPDKPMLVRYNGERWKKNQYRRQLLEANRKARIKPPANFHAIRHSYASAMKLAGVDDTIIAEALGHSSTAMVQKHYGHLEESHKDEQIRENAIDLDVKLKDEKKIVSISRH